MDLGRKKLRRGRVGVDLHGKGMATDSLGKICKTPQDADSLGCGWLFGPAFPALFAAPPWLCHTHATAPRCSAASWPRARVLPPPLSRRSTSGSSRHVPPEVQWQRRNTLAGHKLTPHDCHCHCSLDAALPHPKLWMTMLTVRDSRQPAYQANAQDSHDVVVLRHSGHARRRGCVFVGALSRSPTTSHPCR